MMMIRRAFIIGIITWSWIPISFCLIEHERVEEYYRRGHTWPPEDYNPKTEGWQQLFERRFRQIESVKDRGARYDGFMSAVHSALLCPNFTENGWGLTRAPQGVVDELRRHLHKGLAMNLPEEHKTQVIDTDDPAERPLMIEDKILNQRILNELKPIHEAWSGVELVGNNAYGLRIYRNSSSLNMHVDKTATHIISSILHVDHDPMSDPWPIVIEDFQGNLHEVNLESGDLLLYESSKCLHGRPRKFNGAWYSSLFIHYFPTDWAAQEIHMDAHYRVPPHWVEPLPKTPELDELTVVESSVKEPLCENNWCGLKTSLKTSGPAEAYGRVLSTGGQFVDLNLEECNERVMT